MKAIIMAGGQGTRLRPLTCSVPKPLAKLCGRPVVHYILDLLDLYGFSEATFTLGYKAEQIERLFETGQYKGINLRFSREDTPLGTAGCVKHALSSNSANYAHSDSTPLLVISGDALCDFDLGSAFEYHNRTGASATIITKRVSDPREYGLVLSERGRVTGFSEKPSYLGAIGDCANTGVYILSPEVTELIPDGEQYDFARDVFPKMLAAGMSLFSYEETGYWCDIGDFSTYAQSQFDILAGNVRCNIDRSRIHGNSYVGRNVTVGANTAIDSCIIGDNVTIGSNVKLFGTVILDSAFISDGVTANHAIICAGAKILHSASVYEGAVIGEKAQIGREAIISGGVKIWSEKIIPNGANITRDMKYGCKSAAELSDGGLSGQTNADITPELCTRLGAAVATVSSPAAISCDDNAASRAFKHAVMAGICGGGGNVYDAGTVTRPRLIYAAGLLGCGVIVRVKCGAFAEIEICGSHGLGLTRQEERRLEGALSRSEYKNADWDSFGEIRTVAGFEHMYTSMLKNHAQFGSPHYRVKLNCNNAMICDSLEPLFGKISAPHGEVLVVTLTDGGTKAEFYTEADVKIAYEQLLLLAAAKFMQSGHDVALPNDFASCADYLATSYGRKIHRYFICSNDNSDSHARKLAARQMFLRDGAVLALNVLEYLAENNMTVGDALNGIPQFVSERREIEINCPPQRIISKLCSAKSSHGIGEGVLLGNNRENVIVRAGKRGNSLFLLAESLSSETASELCDNAENLIKRIMEKS
jgi:mannose-1-phosphate guanylyltransferase/phosphomannomutase